MNKKWLILFLSFAFISNLFASDIKNKQNLVAAVVKKSMYDKLFNNTNHLSLARLAKAKDKELSTIQKIKPLTDTQRKEVEALLDNDYAPISRFLNSNEQTEMFKKLLAKNVSVDSLKAALTFLNTKEGQKYTVALFKANMQYNQWQEKKLATLYKMVFNNNRMRKTISKILRKFKDPS